MDFDGGAVHVLVLTAIGTELAKLVAGQSLAELRERPGLVFS